MISDVVIPIFSTNRNRYEIDCIYFIASVLIRLAFSPVVREYRQVVLLSDFNTDKAEETQKIKAYCDKVNIEFADYMRRTWPNTKQNRIELVPLRPEPLSLW